MIFSPTLIPGAFTVDLERKCDDRGFFARAFCTAEFEAHALAPAVAQCKRLMRSRRDRPRQKDDT
jgi:dTDP-4-dehydrorhamnose 3,5-epimerase